MTVTFAPRPVPAAPPGGVQESEQLVYEVTLVCVPQSVSLARMVVGTTLTQWSLTELADDAVMVASELVSNAVRHTVSPFLPPDEPATCRLELAMVGPGRLRVGVSDGSTRPVKVKKPDDEAEGGRGLLLVSELAERWSVTKRSQGKTVWAELAAVR